MRAIQKLSAIGLANFYDRVQVRWQGLIDDFGQIFGWHAVSQAVITCLGLLAFEPVQDPTKKRWASEHLHGRALSGMFDLVSRNCIAFPETVSLMLGTTPTPLRLSATRSPTLKHEPPTALPSMLS